MRRLGSVQRKMPCVFVTEVKEEPSTKREHQPFKVLATETISHKALDADIYSAIPTEKVDGTCCYITNYKEFFWNVEEDFKPVPECWIPAKEIEQLNGNPMPDENGHIPGWVPVEKNNKQYCWHSSVVNYEFEVALVLKHHPDDPGLLEISAVPLSDLLEQTLELIGTNINGNPYGLGSKKHPLHLLIPHGAFQIRNLPTLKHNDLLSWFEGCREGKIEGIVWHCNDGCLIKVHRHHLGLCWPIPDTYMNSKPVIINMNLNKYDHAFDTKSLFNLLSKIDNQKFGRLRDIILDV
uniref:RNA ligase 1 n=1 Tax=Felis catus TaxID=9685 RepID=A0ABI7XAS2_FELCA